MKHHTSELTGASLDAAVAKALGWRPSYDGKHWDVPVTPAMQYISHRVKDFKPSTDWGLGGPIIDSEDISLLRVKPDSLHDDPGRWRASTDAYDKYDGPWSPIVEQSGPTALIAAMRALVAAKLSVCGEVELP